MPLQPGPFRLGTAADVTGEPGTYDFTHDAQALHGEVLATTSGWDDLLADLDNLGAGVSDVAIGVDLPGIVSDLEFISAHLPLSYFGDMLQGFFDAQDMLGAATAFAPQQAWTDPGAPFVPPDSAFVLVPPTIDPDAYVPTANITVGVPATNPGASVSLSNFTRIGSANFVVGDSYRIYAVGTPGDHLTATGVFNGEQLPVTDYGPLGETGFLYLEGVMGPDNVGAWSQQWFIGSKLKAKFDFVVTDS